MGTPRLKIKNELNYRRGYTSRSCRYCNHIQRSYRDKDECLYRCELIGLQGGRLFDINPNHICDRYDNSRYLTMLEGQG